MYYELKSLNIKSSIISFNIAKDKIILLTNQYMLIVLDENSYGVLSQKKISNKFENRHVYDSSFSISNKLDIFLTQPKNTKSYLLKLSDKLENKATLSFNKKTISCSTFNNSATILSIGGEDGKLFFYNIKDNKLVKSFQTRPDYVSNVVFSKDDKFTAISYYDKTNIVYSFVSGYEEHKFVSDDVVYKAMFLPDNITLVCATRGKRLFTYNLLDKKISNIDFELYEWPTSIVNIKENFILVGTRSKYLYIVDIAKNFVIGTVEFDNSGITTLFIKKNKLYISFTNGEIKVINLENNLDEYELALKLKKYAEATKYIEKNIFLVTHEITKIYDDNWGTVLLDAKKLLVSKSEKDAKALVKPFLFDKGREDEFSFCLGNLSDYKTFTTYIEEKKYIDAFRLIDESPFLKKTKDYDALEKNFIKIVHDAKSLFLKGDNLSLKRAQELLSGYNTIKSKADLVNNLLSKYKIFIQADRLIKDRNFGQYFLLVDKNSFLKEEEIYNRVIMIGNHTLEKLNHYEQEYNYIKALEVADYLKVFLPFKEEIDKKIKEIEKLSYFYENIKKDSVINVYNMVEENSSLTFFSPFISFHDKFLALKKQAHNFAINGEASKILKLLNRYMRIDFLVHLIAQEFKIAYLTQLEEATKNSENIDIKESLKHYVVYFGLDNDLIHLLEVFDLDQEFLQIKSSDKTDGYKENTFVESILILK